ncbi:hypothetical protein ACROYT_G017022 [Oculina patagonica]
MSTDFDRAYQHQSFNLQFPASFNHDPVSSNRALFFNNTEITEGNSEIDQPAETTQVKMELKERIKLKYLEKGTEIPKIEELTRIEPPKPKIKEEDPEVIMKRRERNKIAATKCRKLKRERIEKLEKRTNKLVESKRKLQHEKDQLNEELRRLTLWLRNHYCKRKPTTSADNWSADMTLWGHPDPEVFNAVKQMFMNVEQ